MPNLPNAHLENPAMQGWKRNGFVRLDRSHPVGSRIRQGAWLSESHTQNLAPWADTAYAPNPGIVYHNIAWQDNRPMFNGVSSRIELFAGHNLRADFSPEDRLNHTFSCEFMLDEGSGRRTILGGYGGAPTIYYDNVTGKLRVEKPGAVTTVESTQTIELNRRYQLDYTQDYRGLTDGVNFHFLSLDGELDGAGSTAVNYGWYGLSMQLGVSESLSEWWSGTIDIPSFTVPRLSPELVRRRALFPYEHFAQ